MLLFRADKIVRLQRLFASYPVSLHSVNRPDSIQLYIQGVTRVTLFLSITLQGSSFPLRSHIQSTNQSIHNQGTNHQCPYDEVNMVL